MNNKLNRHVASDKVKWIAVTLAILLIGVALAAALTNGFKTANPYCWLGHTYEKGSTVCSVCGKECEHKHWKDGKCKDCGFACEHDYLNGKCKICGEKESEVRENSLEVTPYKSSGIKLLSAPVPRASGSAKESLQLTATLSPADAKECAVDWDVSWAQENSGKIVTDYVTITPTTDGALTATLNYLQVFDKQIIVKVALRDNSDINATATVDCIGEFSPKVIAGSDTYGASEYFEGYFSLSRVPEYTWTLPDSDPASEEHLKKGMFQIFPESTRGTLDVSLSCKFTVKASSNLISELNKEFPSESSKFGRTVTYTRESKDIIDSSSLIANYPLSFGYFSLFVPLNALDTVYYNTEGLFSFISDGFVSRHNQINSEKYNKLRKCFLAASDDLVFKFSLTFSAKNKNKTVNFDKEFTVNISDSSLETLATDVSLSQNSVIF